MLFRKLRVIENKTLNLIVELSGVAKNGNTGDAGEIASAVLGAQIGQYFYVANLARNI